MTLISEYFKLFCTVKLFTYMSSTYVFVFPSMYNFFFSVNWSFLNYKENSSFQNDDIFRDLPFRTRMYLDDKKFEDWMSRYIPNLMFISHSRCIHLQKTYFKTPCCSQFWIPATVQIWWQSGHIFWHFLYNMTLLFGYFKLKCTVKLFTYTSSAHLFFFSSITSFSHKPIISQS